MASTAQNHIAATFRRLREPLKTLWQKLGEPPQRGWAHQLVTRASREAITISPRHCLVFCARGPREVPLLVRECGYTYFSVVDQLVASDSEANSDIRQVVTHYEEAMQLAPTEVCWEYPCLKLQFGGVTIEHHLCLPGSLDLPKAPDLVLIWDISSGCVHHSQKWVTKLAPGATILSSDFYPLLQPDETYRLGQHPYGGSAACYRAQEIFYGPMGFTIHETHGLFGYATKN